MHVRSGDDAPVTVDLSFPRSSGGGEGGRGGGTRQFSLLLWFAYNIHDNYSWNLASHCNMSQVVAELRGT